MSTTAIAIEAGVLLGAAGKGIFVVALMMAQGPRVTARSGSSFHPSSWRIIAARYLVQVSREIRENQKKGDL